MSNRILAATRKGVFTLERNNGRWEIARTAFLGDNSPMLMHDQRDGALYVALSLGHFGSKMHRSRDGGESWQEIAVPAYPEKPAGIVETTPWGDKPIEWKLMLIWALEPGGGDQPGRLWCGTIPGGLFRSDDHGSSWKIVRPLWDEPRRLQWFGGGADFPGIHSVCVDPRNSQHLRVGVSCGGVWETRDDGASWDCRATGMWAAYMPPERKDDPNIQDPHRVVQCRTQPQYLWAQHHNAVFRSTDGSASWQEVTTIAPSVFGFAVAVHPRDPDTAWFVPAIKDERRIPVDGNVVVARTRDGGRSCEVLRNGLPQRYAYDITFRHGLDVDDSGERLAFGTTTGSLWTSDDQGDSWQAVSEHLPPIYCVRFAKD
jgi:hypothetical protein